MTGSNRSIGLKIDTPLTVEHIYFLLLEVWVYFNLIDNGLDTASRNEISELWHYTVADTDGLGETSIYESLHF